MEGSILNFVRKDKWIVQTTVNNRNINKVLNMFRVNNKDTRTTPFTLCSRVSTVNFEHVIAGWEGYHQSKKALKSHTFSCFSGEYL